MEIVAFGKFAPEWNAYRSIRKLRRAMGLKPAAPDQYFLFKESTEDGRSIATGVMAHKEIDTDEELKEIMKKVQGLECFEKTAVSIITPAHVHLGIELEEVEDEETEEVEEVEETETTEDPEPEPESEPEIEAETVEEPEEAEES